MSAQQIQFWPTGLTVGSPIASVVAPLRVAVREVFGRDELVADYFDWVPRNSWGLVFLATPEARERWLPPAADWRFSARDELCVVRALLERREEVDAHIHALVHSREPAVAIARLGQECANMWQLFALDLMVRGDRPFTGSLITIESIDPLVPAPNARSEPVVAPWPLAWPSGNQEPIELVWQQHQSECDALWVSRRATAMDSAGFRGFDSGVRWSGRMWLPNTPASALPSLGATAEIAAFSEGSGQGAQPIRAKLVSAAELAGSFRVEPALPVSP